MNVDRVSYRFAELCSELNSVMVAAEKSPLFAARGHTDCRRISDPVA
jgi:hypothetical protein